MRFVRLFSYTLLLFIIITQVGAQTYLIPNLQRDDFKDSKSWWAYREDGQQAAPTTHDGYMLLQLVDPLVPPGSPDPGRTQGARPANMENTGIASAETRDIYDKNNVMHAIMRVKALNPSLEGSRGWGFWAAEWIPVTTNQAAWFMEQKALPDCTWSAEETWWRARIHRTVDTDFDFSVELDGSSGSPFNYDIEQWHTYEVIRDGIADQYIQIVDGDTIQVVTPADFPDGKILNEDYSFHLWDDNLVYRSTVNAVSGLDTVEVFGNRWQGSSEMVVDFVEIRSGYYDPSYSVTPIGNILLREVINEIDDGISNGPFKGPYTFSAQNGRVIILATAKAEELGIHDDDDDLKMILSDGTTSTDFGYDTPQSWNGLALAGAVKTVMIDTVLNSNSYTLSFESEVTPILYDATVLGSPDGSVVLNQTVDESAPDGSNNLEWKSYNFSTDPGEIVIYISGSADEEPGWNHLNATIDSTDDDELRVELNGYDFGWGSDSASFVGNTLFGDNKTLCFRATVGGGQQTLKLFTRESPFVHKVIVFAENGDYSLPVSLTSLSAQQMDGFNRISWVAQSELNNAGFHVYRAVTQTNEAPARDAYRRITQSMISGRGNASSAKEYFFDDHARPENGYSWYIVEDISTSGAKTEHGPVSISAVSPLGYELKQNYPNPFNPQTTFGFSLPLEEKVTIEIFDVNGRLVDLALSKKMPAGKHAISWTANSANGRPLASGVYYYRLRTPSFSTIKKMVLIR